MPLLPIFHGRIAALAVVALALPGAVALAAPAKGTDGRTRSADGLEIAYTVRGTADPALVFIHGGLADRSFWAPQMDSLSGQFRVVALDLGGHGASGRGRKEWRVAGWARDVQAVVKALKLKKVVLIGNSLGGPVALEAAALLKGRVIGVIGVDTLHRATEVNDPAEVQAQADAFRKDFGGTCRQMVNALFHPGAHAELHAWAEKKMCACSPEVVVGMMEGWAGYDLAAAFRGAGAPIRVINGDLWPTDVETNRKVAPGFDAVILEDAGHYPMLERPDEFNRVLMETVRGLEEPGAPRR